MLSGEKEKSLVERVLDACSAKLVELPTAALSKKCYALMEQGGDGVSSTFFEKPAPARITLQGPSGEVDATEVITTAAVIHISKALSEVRLLLNSYMPLHALGTI